MLIEDPPETRTDAPDQSAGEEVAPPPEDTSDLPLPQGEGQAPQTEPQNVGAPAEASEEPASEAEAAAEEEADVEPSEALAEELLEPDEEPGSGDTEEVTPALEREDTPAEIEAVAVQEPEDQVTAEAETPDAAEASEEAEEAAASETAEPEEVVPAAEAEAEPAEVPAVAAGDGDPFGGPGDWYVIHTYAGYENKVKTNLESRIHTMQMEEKIFDVHIPMEDVMEIKGGKKQVVQKKVFPGYLLVKMVYDDDSWYVVRNTPGVTGFVSSGTGQKPTPLSRREVEKILTVKEEEAKKPAFRLEFEEGDVVRIISGPFADFNGTISDINVDQSKLRVMVNIFDRETPVELGFDQVAKV
jgi:transcriptional antiterminator NusG